MRHTSYRSTIMATGGAGYIGAHVVVELQQAGFDVVIFDNFENANPDVIDRIEKITGSRPEVVRGDLRSETDLATAFDGNKIDAVVHFAGKKAVGESVAAPLSYYHSNVAGTVNLLLAMTRAGVDRMVFSSSATVYGSPEDAQIPETAPTSPTNPYGRSKLMIEEMICDLVQAGELHSAYNLRYFNPVGAHPSGLIGEKPSGPPQNLFPSIAQTAAGMRGAVKIFGADYPTPDGTGIRDYIHVVDLAQGHIAAIQRTLGQESAEGSVTLNLGTGRGISVLEAVRAFSDTCGFEIPREQAPRRPGDVAYCVADPRLAGELIGWKASKTIEEMCADHWRFQQTEVKRKASAE